MSDKINGYFEAFSGALAEENQIFIELSQTQIKKILKTETDIEIDEISVLIAARANLLMNESLATRSDKVMTASGAADKLSDRTLQIKAAEKIYKESISLAKDYLIDSNFIFFGTGE